MVRAAPGCSGRVAAVPAAMPISRFRRLSFEATSRVRLKASPSIQWIYRANGSKGPQLNVADWPLTTQIDVRFNVGNWVKSGLVANGPNPTSLTHIGQRRRVR